MSRYALACALVLVATAAARQPCTPHWSDQYPVGGPQYSSPSGGAIRALFPFNDGSGPRLYVGGDFTGVGPVQTFGIARFDGGSWSDVGGGTPTAPGSAITAMATFNDGSGLALYAAGNFTAIGNTQATHIAKWNGTQWAQLGAGPNNAPWSMAVFDDGGGPALYIAGGFTTAGGLPVSGLARWSGSTWSAVTSTSSPSGVYALAVFDDGAGPAVYLGGTFQSINGVPASNVARWDGLHWSALGAGVDNTVGALLPVDLPSGRFLAVAGAFTSAGGAAANRIAAWNGSAWSSLGGGPSGNISALGCLAQIDDGSGPAMYAGGYAAPSGVVRWNGASWQSVGQIGEVWCMNVFDDGAGPALYAGGPFTNARNGYGTWRGLAKWNGSEWQTSLGSHAADRLVTRLIPCATPAGPAMLATGYFSCIGGITSLALALRDSTGWHDLGLPIGCVATDAAKLDTPTGTMYFAHGYFPRLGSISQEATAIRQNDVWSINSTGSVGGPLIMHTDSSGSSIYSFVQDQSQWRLARWNAGTWTPMGSSLGPAPSPFSVALSLDDGSGPAIYASGNSTSSGGAFRGVARWDGVNWSQAGSDLPTQATALAAFNVGTGPTLVAAYSLPTGGGSTADVALLRGQTWQSIGNGGMDSISLLAVADDGSGPALFAAGRPTGGFMNITKWDGHIWTAVCEEVYGTANGMAGFADASGSSLFVGGDFGSVNDIPSANIAELIACPHSTCYPNCDNSSSPPLLSAADFICFLNRYAISDPYANCDQSTASPTLNVADFICFMNKYAIGCP